MGIVRDKSVLQTSVPPEQREPRVYNPDGKVLVIVESPAKSKTIEKFLGPNYVVKASMGQMCIRDRFLKASVVVVVVL